MSEVLIEDLDLIADSRVYDVAKYFNLEYKEDRLAYKDALKNILAWGEKHAKTDNVDKILLAIAHKERGLVKDGFEPRINNFRRALFVEELEPERPKRRAAKPKEEVKEVEPEVKTEEPKEEPKVDVAQPSWGELFKQGLHETR